MARLPPHIHATHTRASSTAVRHILAQHLFGHQHATVHRICAIHASISIAASSYPTQCGTDCCKSLPLSFVLIVFPLCLSFVSSFAASLRPVLSRRVSVCSSTFVPFFYVYRLAVIYLFSCCSAFSPSRARNLLLSFAYVLPDPHQRFCARYARWRLFNVRPPKQKKKNRGQCALHGYVYNSTNNKERIFLMLLSWPVCVRTGHRGISGTCSRTHEKVTHPDSRAE